jgi:hypothetical protein
MADLAQLKKAYEEIRAVAQTLSPVAAKAANGDVFLAAHGCLELAALIAVKGMHADQETRTKLATAFAQRMESLTTSEQEGSQ